MKAKQQASEVRTLQQAPRTEQNRTGRNHEKREVRYGGTHVLAAAHAEGLDLVERRGVGILVGSRRLRRGTEVHHHAPFITGARH